MEIGLPLNFESNFSNKVLISSYFLLPPANCLNICWNIAFAEESKKRIDFEQENQCNDIQIMATANFLS